jgi:hypothetical protein
VKRQRAFGQESDVLTARLLATRQIREGFKGAQAVKKSAGKRSNLSERLIEIVTRTRWFR